MLLLIKILFGIYLVLLAIVFLAQRKMIYFPADWPFAAQLKAAEAHNFEVWKSPAGQIIGWKQLARSTKAQAQILIVHGNAGSAIDRMDYADGLQHAQSCDIYILEYPGYGGRAGTPSQQSFFQSATEAISLLKQDVPVYVIGESLGTGVAAYLAGTNPQVVHGLLLIAPYNNMSDVAQNHMPIFPVRWMLWDKFPSDQYLQNYHGPIGILLAGQDTVVPSKFGRKLHDGYAGPKKLWLMPNAGHNDVQLQPEAWWQEVVEFWRTNQQR
ncbi:alpha/beta hydrolase [Pedosphaera parvula]|uniref:AB hydrolase-1 domain-containing protein n=1 Tax=Pedosphaera parvula (strain Ellin514) TaxID=320771 RepID=B9XSR6_PEDPL|nr:alpha/beta hydrolase [Pedosphaera parvula]EEF57118.1 conserved hypothetical protein [Pedosphaera parvula Ellin514]